MDKLAALTAFCSVAETLHFRESAQRLGVSPQVISRLIRDLEQSLGETLFQRNTRQVKLTDFAQQLLPEAQALVQQSHALFRRHQPRQPQQQMAGVVRIAVPTMPLMESVLRQLLMALQDYPDLNIDWRTDLNKVDVIDEQIDLGIRFGTPADNRLIIRKVGVVEDCIVTTPRLIAERGKPQDWQDLQRNYPLSALLNRNTGRAWQWYLSNAYQFTPQNPKLLTGNMQDELNVVLTGQTIACLPRPMCQPYLDKGELVELFAEIPRKQWLAYLYRPQQNVTPPRVKWVFDLLADIFQRSLTQAEEWLPS